MSGLLDRLPKINLRRTYLIARRDFVGYVKTWGFWLTTFGPFIGLGLLVLASVVMVKAEPTTYITIKDETGIHGKIIMERVSQGLEIEAIPSLGEIAAPTGENYVGLPVNNIQIIDPPTQDLTELKSYLIDNKSLKWNGTTVKLSGVLHIYDTDNTLSADFWTTSPQNEGFSIIANKYFTGLAQNDYLESGGLSYDGLALAVRESTRVEKFNPEKSITSDQGQKVTFQDGLPFFVAAGLALMLWLTIFTGAYMLLVSMVEEKINKVLEMLLATTRFAEIFVGKLIGVAALTMTSLLPWFIAAVIGMILLPSAGDLTIASTIRDAMDTKMLVFLPVFLVVGYVFYGSMFVALGAVAESMQDASTLMTPMVLLMTVCMMVVPIGLNYPESPILIFGQWFPFSAPFAAIVRLPADPPLWETLLSVLSLILSSVFVIWFSSRIFQHGVLSGGGVVAIKDWFTHKVLRRT